MESKNKRQMEVNKTNDRPIIFICFVICLIFGKLWKLQRKAYSGYITISFIYSLNVAT